MTQPQTYSEFPPPPPRSFSPPTSKGLAIAAMVLGFCSFIPCLGMLTGITAVILGIVSLATRQAGKGMAVIGLVAGIAGPVFWIVLWIGGLVGIVPRTFMKAKEQANIAVCSGNLNAVAKAIFLYRNDHDDKFPPDTDALVDAGLLLDDAFKCPSAKSTRTCDYFIHFPSSPDAPGETIIACDFKGNHGNGRNVLYLDGRVQLMKEEDFFQAELDETQNAEFKAALTQIEWP